MSRPTTERMKAALARIAAGEKPYAVAVDLKIASSQVYRAIKNAREAANRRSQAPAPSSRPAPD